jgi:hypothetical protein
LPLRFAHETVEKVISQRRLHGQLTDGIVDVLAPPFEPRMDPAGEGAQLEEDGFAVFPRLGVPTQSIG